MKTALTTLITCSLLATTAFADSFESQHRVGIGYNKAEINNYLDDSRVDWGNGIKLEYGYEFNRIAGINLSYAENKDKESGYGFTTEIDGSNFQIDTDLGYKFDLDGFSIKPYGLIGIARHSEENSIRYEEHKLSETYKDTSVVVGVGARAEVGQHFYTDMRFELASYDDVDYDTFSWTFGYRF